MNNNNNIIKNYLDIKNFLTKKRVLSYFWGLFFILNLTLFFMDSIYCLLCGFATLFMATIGFVHMFINNKLTTSNDENSIIKDLIIAIIIQLLPVFVFLCSVFNLVEKVPFLQIIIIKYTFCFFIIYILLIFLKFNMIFVAENLKIINFYDIKKLVHLFNKHRIYNLLTFFIDTIILFFSFYITNKYAKMLYLNVYYLITISFMLTYTNMYKNLGGKK